MTDARLVTFSCGNPPLRVQCWLGQDKAPQIVGGLGGWQTVSRPHRKSLTQYQGVDPLQQDLPITLGSYASQQPVNDDFASLVRMARDPDGGEPPIIKVSGHIHYPELLWIVNDITWEDDAIRQDRTGYLLLINGTVHLMEYVDDDRLQAVPAAEAARRAAASTAAATARKGGGKPSAPSHPKTYSVRAGDTLSSIAAKYLGSYKRWTEIASLNGIRDPNNVKAGQQLRMP